MPCEPSLVRVDVCRQGREGERESKTETQADKEKEKERERIEVKNTNDMPFLPSLETVHFCRQPREGLPPGFKAETSAYTLFSEVMGGEGEKKSGGNWREREYDREIDIDRER